MSYRLEDEFVKGVLAPSLWLSLAVLFLPSIGVVVSSPWLLDNENDPMLIDWFLDFLSSFRGIPGDLTALVLQVLPTILAALCFRGTGEGLSFVGKVSLVTLLLGIFCTLVALIIVQLVRPENLPHGENTVSSLEQICGAAFRIGFGYLALLIGLQIDIKRKE